MRAVSRHFGLAALALAMATGSATLGGAAQAKDKPAKEPAKVGNSKEFATAAGPLQQTLTTAQAAVTKFNAAPAGAAKDAAMAELRAAFAPAPAQLAAAEAAIKSPADRMLAGQWGNMVGTVLGDEKLVLHSLNNIIESGLAPADKLSLYQYQLGSAAYGSKDYAGAIKALTPLVAGNYAENSAAEILADAYAKSGQPVQGLAALAVAVDARKAAGGEVPQNWFNRANAIAYNGKLDREGMDWAVRMAGARPSAINWLGAGQLVRIYGKFSGQDSVDISRLMFRAGALAIKGKETEREYVEYIQAADPRRFPGEVVRVADAGLAMGALRSGDTFVSDALSQARGRVAADKASLPAGAKSAAAAASGVPALAIADAFLSYGQNAEAEATYKIALQKGGIDKDRALLRMGIAQLDAGNLADAKASFGQVTGERSPIAKLWLAYAATKG